MLARRRGRQPDALRRATAARRSVATTPCGRSASTPNPTTCCPTVCSTRSACPPNGRRSAALPAESALGSNPVLRQGGNVQGLVPGHPAMAGLRGRAHHVQRRRQAATTGGFESEILIDPRRAVGAAADDAARPLVGARRAGADGDRAVTDAATGPRCVVDKPPGMTSHDVVGTMQAHLRHPQGRSRGHARPDGHRCAGGRHRAGHQDPRPADRDRQVVRRDHPAGPDHHHRRRRRRSVADGFGRGTSPTPTSRPRWPRCAARSRRSRRRSAPSRSAASGPTSSPARDRLSSWPPVRCASTGSRCSASGVTTASSTSTSRSTARAARTSGRWPATSAPRSASAGT